MEKNFANDDFEDFLRQNADSLRMRPAEKVWEGISKNLNKRRRRFGWGLGTLLLATCALGYLSIDNFHKKESAVAENKNNATAKPPASYPKPVLAWKNNTLIEKEKALSARNSILSVSAVQPGFEKGAETPAIFPTIENSQLNEDVFNVLPVDDIAPGQQISTTFTDIQAKPEASDPLSIESVVNQYKPGKMKKKASVQWYFTPTVSYRKLSENKSYLRSATGNSIATTVPAYLDVNNMVKHKPGMGLELGFAVRYPLSPKLKLRSGLQFNVTRYEIQAFNSVLEPATIVLNSRTTTGTESINRYTSLNTTSGFNSDWLQNFYLQISAPVGVEYNFAGNQKVQFGVATTIQPTYVLDDRAYLISTDYKKYAEVPELSRKWNVNTALETYVSYSTGRLAWQVGPQVRYQLLSSFVNKYPVKENLFDYGLKVGISLNRDNH